MKLFYYNQLNYDNVPYNKPNGAKKSIATSGCGVCSPCIVFNTLAQKEIYTIKEMAQFSIKHGARTNDGTDELTLLKELCKVNKNFSFETTNDINKLVKHLKSGGMAICNQGSAYNVFSNAGHYVVAYRLVDGNIQVVDPSNKSNKYDLYNRPQRIVKKTDTGCIVKPAIMDKATADRNPSFYLITYTPPKAKAPTIKNGVYKLTADRGVYKGYGASTGRKQVADLTPDGKKNATAKKGDAYLKAGTKVTISENKLLSSGNLWAKIPSGFICIWEEKTNKKFIK